MSREIKFRGISAKEDKFIIGSLAYMFNDVLYPMIMPNSYYSTKHLGEYDDEDEEIISETEFALGGFIPVKPETVGQYIGLKDKNGKDAYVGNIYKETLTDCSQRYFKIFNVPGGFAVNEFQDDFYKPIENILFWRGLSDMQTASWFQECLEEIGNIHENPERLNIK